MGTYNKLEFKVGEKYGRLTVVGEERVPSSRPDQKTERRISCLCDCGNKSLVTPSRLKNRVIKSCGCYHLDKVTTHGLSKTSPEYQSWIGMKERCLNESRPRYKDYGGRGITICERWINSFENFLHDVGEKPSKYHTLDRIDNDDNYCPENVRWATKKQQGNNRRTNRIIEAFGESHTMTQWADKYGINRDTLRSRLENGMSLEQAVCLPVKKTSVPLMAFGRSQTLKQWADEFDMEYMTLLGRIKRGLSLEEALSTPVRKSKKK